MLELAGFFPEENLNVVDLPYRFSSWALDDPLNVRLWFDAGQHMVSWAVLQAPFWSLDYAFQPGYADSLHVEILDWAKARIQQLPGSRYFRPAWFVNVFEEQMQRRTELEQAGFADQANVETNPWSKVWLCLDEETPLPQVELPPGFSIRSLNGGEEISAYVNLHQNVFESKSMTIPWRQRTLGQPAYQPHSDLVAISPEGGLAAFCIGWYRPGTRDNKPTGQIEPMGVGKPFRRMGLGKAVLTECLVRLRKMGAEKIFVETDNYRDAARILYEAVGFRIYKNVLVYRKDID